MRKLLDKLRGRFRAKEPAEEDLFSSANEVLGRALQACDPFNSLVLERQQKAEPAYSQVEIDQHRAVIVDVTNGISLASDAFNLIPNDSRLAGPASRLLAANVALYGLALRRYSIANQFRFSLLEKLVRESGRLKDKLDQMSVELNRNENVSGAQREELAQMLISVTKKRDNAIESLNECKATQDEADGLLATARELEATLLASSALSP